MTAPVPIQIASNQAAGATASIGTGVFGAAVAAGNTIEFLVAYFDPTNSHICTMSRVGDGVGQFTQSNTYWVGSVGLCGGFIKNASAGTAEVRVTFGGGSPTFVGIWADEVPGLASSGVLFVGGESTVQAQSAPGTGTDAVKNPPITPSIHPCLYRGWCLNPNSATNIPVVGTGFTGQATAWTSVGYALKPEYAEANVGTPISATWTAPVDQPYLSFGMLLQYAPTSGPVMSGATAITEGASFTVSGTGFSASGNSVTINGVAQTVTAESITSITCTAVLGINQYGTIYPLLVTNASAQVSAVPLNVGIANPATFNYVNLIDPLVPVAQRLHGGPGLPDLAGGMQVRWFNVTGGFSLADVNVYSDAEWIATPGQYSFQAQSNDGTGWGVVGTQTIGVTSPLVVTNPANQTVFVGQTATFSVTASGTISGYQWLKNGSPIPGATSPSYTTPAAVLGDNGSLFSVQVTGNSMTVVSAPATLTVNAIPPPVSGTSAGRTVQFPLEAGDSVNLPFDFASHVSKGEVISSIISVTATVHSGVDPNPSGIFDGAPFFNGHIVYQPVAASDTALWYSDTQTVFSDTQTAFSDGVDSLAVPDHVGVIYILDCQVVTSLGRRLEMTSYFAVMPVEPS